MADGSDLRNPWFTVSTLVYGLFVLLAVPVVVSSFGGAGYGPTEIGSWLLLVVAWVAAWGRGRSRDPGVRDSVHVEHSVWFTGAALLLGLAVLYVLPVLVMAFSGAIFGELEIMTFLALVLAWVAFWAGGDTAPDRGEAAHCTLNCQDRLDVTGRILRCAAFGNS